MAEFDLVAKLTVLLGYLIGSIPFGLLLTRVAGLGDIRKVGSGNIGATNVLRTGNKGIAILTLLLDGGKGAIAVFIALQISPDYAPLAGTAAFFGHIYPLWLRFKGGKGVATFMGTMLAISWPVGLLCVVTWLVFAFSLRLSSLAALMAAAVAPGLSYLLASNEITILSLIMAAMILIAHRDNIGRIQRGEEPRIGGSKIKKPDSE